MGARTSTLAGTAVASGTVTACARPRAALSSKARCELLLGAIVVVGLDRGQSGAAAWSCVQIDRRRRNCSAVRLGEVERQEVEDPRGNLMCRLSAAETQFVRMPSQSGFTRRLVLWPNSGCRS